ncbi:hypothetical protein K466DRAFT_61159 [Polyporus arcularius HHB13444]|uniref:F-box domain-containing protein n=1 Tax=Polyporus arcularius HHB13444 TaxID=1314778 RepID=A0A5C3PGI3_9APHY|nr:hypothetical protein K466DRAFT_61159 [Polyporus arcularius HHB13444]
MTTSSHSSEKIFPFTFSVPLHAVIPLSRDPNLLPLPEHQSDKCGESSAMTYRLTTIVVDVQRLILSLLDMKDLSSLMKTCSYFLDLGLPELIGRIPNQAIVGLDKAVSFLNFLRVGGGPFSRRHLVEALWLAFPRSSQYYNCPRPYKPHKLYKNHIATLLSILRHCSYVRRLRIQNWPWDFEVDNLNTTLHTIARYMTALQHLTIPLASTSEHRHLTKVARLPLRKLVLSSSTLCDIPTPQMSLVMNSLSQTVVTLDRIVLPEDFRRHLPNVRMLGLWMNRQDSAVVENMTAAFPNVTSFRLHSSHHTDRDYYCACGSFPDLEMAPVREHNQPQWQPGSWPSLEAVWAARLCDLYCLGASRHIPCLSVPVEKCTRSVLSVILAETRPSFLELRVGDSADETVLDSPGLEDLAAPSSLHCLALRFTNIVCAATTQWVLDGLERSSGLKDSSLTHLLLRWTLEEPTALNDGGVSFLPRDREQPLPFPWPMASHSLPQVAQALPTLRWIGVDVCGWGLKSWKVSRPTGAAPATLIEMSEQSGRRVVQTMQMDAFSKP